MKNIQQAAQAVSQMDEQLRCELLFKGGEIQQKKLWENTFIARQIERRSAGGTFTLADHLRAMVYSMLSAGIPWERAEQGIDPTTGRILPIDEIFGQFDAEFILRHSPEYLTGEIQKLHCGSLSTLQQMQALTERNIGKLQEFEANCGSVDAFYQTLIAQDRTLKALVKALSDAQSKDKLVQMGEALTAEYLKNVGYSIAKPDRHICRILGADCLACSDKKTVPAFEAIDIVAAIAAELQKSAAEVDYILWSYCAKGYGAVCTLQSPKCEICVAKKHCRRG